MILSPVAQIVLFCIILVMAIGVAYYSIKASQEGVRADKLHGLLSRYYFEITDEFFDGDHTEAENQLRLLQTSHCGLREKLFGLREFIADATGESCSGLEDSGSLAANIDIARAYLETIVTEALQSSFSRHPTAAILSPGMDVVLVKPAEEIPPTTEPEPEPAKEGDGGEVLVTGLAELRDEFPEFFNNDSSLEIAKPWIPIVREFLHDVRAAQPEGVTFTFLCAKQKYGSLQLDWHIPTSPHDGPGEVSSDRFYADVLDLEDAAVEKCENICERCGFVDPETVSIEEIGGHETSVCENCQKELEAISGTQPKATV